MYDLNYQVDAERRKDLKREAENHRLAQDFQKNEKSNVLKNAMNVLNVLSGNDSKER